MSAIDGATIRNARRFSESPFELRGVVGVVACGTVVVASAMIAS